MNSNAPRNLSLLLLVAVLLTACGTPAPVVTATPESTATPAASPTPAPLLTLKVVTYNILVGGGRDRSLDWHMDEKWRGIDRTPILLGYLKQIDADIIGLQEATGWDEGEPPYIQTVADQLGMHYVALPAWWGLDAALLTKYEVLESENLSDEVNSITRAVLQGPDGEPVNVFVAHLNSDSVNDRACGTQFLLRAMQPYFSQRTFLIGDMNFRPGDSEWGSLGLKQGGWKLLERDNRWGFDQVWAPGSMNAEPSAWSPLIDAGLSKISDHNPAGLELMIYSPSGDVLADTVTPTAMPPVANLPEQVSAAFHNARVTYTDDPDAVCHAQQWLYDGMTASLTQNNLHLYGKQDWQSAANWSKLISENEGVLLDFKFAPKSEFNIFLDYGNWDTPEYRRLGMYLPVGSHPFRADVWRASRAIGDDTWAGITQAQPGTWYRLLLAAGEGGRLRGYVWPVDDPAQMAVYARDMGVEWADLQWKVMLGANRGAIDVRSVMQIAFDGVQ